MTLHVIASSVPYGHLFVGPCHLPVSTATQATVTQSHDTHSCSPSQMKFHGCRHQGTQWREVGCPEKAKRTKQKGSGIPSRLEPCHTRTAAVIITLHKPHVCRTTFVVSTGTLRYFSQNTADKITAAPLLHLAYPPSPPRAARSWATQALHHKRNEWLLQVQVLM